MPPGALPATGCLNIAVTIVTPLPADEPNRSVGEPSWQASLTRVDISAEAMLQGLPVGDEGVEVQRLGPRPFALGQACGQRPGGLEHKDAAISRSGQSLANYGQ